MNNEIVNNINKYVGQDDILYHLGDWSFGGIESIWEFRKRIICNNIHLVLGNHDHHIENNRTITILNEDLLKYDSITSPEIYNRYIHEINGVIKNNKLIGFEVPIQTLFKSVNQMLIKKIDGQEMTLCHYAMRTWNKGHHGAWMLYGHSHNSLPEYNYVGPSMKHANMCTSDIITKPYKTIDVGIDSIYDKYGEYKPIKISEIKKLFRNRSDLRVDHHNDKTN